MTVGASPASSGSTSGSGQLPGGLSRHWLIRWEDLELQRCVGEGSFGRVSSLVARLTRSDLQEAPVLFAQYWPSAWVLGAP